MFPINFFWVGKKLGVLHASCLRSFIKQGHEVILHGYEKPEDAPAGAILADARKLMPEHEIFRHKETGSLAITSDIFRYRLQREGMGLYVDCDVYCVKPFPNQEYVLTWENNTLLNPAILKVPADSQLLRHLLEASENPYFVPPWLSKTKRNKLLLRKFIGRPKHVAQQEWGVIGPQLLTHYVKSLGLEAYSSAADIYAPVYGGMTNLLFEEGLTIQDLITHRTVSIHLYNQGLLNKPIVPNTPIYEIINS